MATSRGVPAGGRSYSFNVASIAPKTRTLAIGATVQGNLDPGTGTDVYTFTAIEGRSLFIDGLDSSGQSVSVSFVSAGGVLLLSANADKDNGPLNITETGTYRLIVSGNTDTPGSYSLRLLDASAAPAIAPGATVSATLQPGTSAALYRIQGTPGEQLHLHFTSDPAMWALYAPDGSNLAFIPVFSPDPNDLDVVLPSAGIYVIVAGGNNPGGSFHYQLQLNTPTVQTAPISFATVTSGTVGPLSQKAYTFTGTAGQIVYFDTFGAPEDLVMATLTSPTGRELFSQFVISDNGPLVLGETGTYKLTMSTYLRAGASGDFRFRLLDSASATPVAIGATISATLTPGASARLYTFAATAGQRPFFQSLSAPIDFDATEWAVYDPAGHRVAGSTLVYNGANNSFEMTPGSDGTYVLVVSGENPFGSDVPYRFTVTAPPLNSGALNTSGVTTGSIATAGQLNAYTFDGSPGAEAALRVAGHECLHHRNPDRPGRPDRIPGDSPLERAHDRPHPERHIYACRRRDRSRRFPPRRRHRNVPP